MMIPYVVACLGDRIKHLSIFSLASQLPGAGNMPAFRAQTRIDLSILG